MKDVAILTKFYKNYNYGGMLQGFALQKVITKLGYTADLISYDVSQNPNSVYPSVLVQAKQYGLRAAVSKVSEKAIGKGKYFIRDLLIARVEKFTQFMDDANANTEKYSDDNMHLVKNRYKTFISGSDQVWNPNAVRNLYLQTFYAGSDRKISYAASIGRDSFSEFEANAIIPAIKRFGSISVRENTAKCLLKKYIDKPIMTVLDPTMLLTKQEWDKVATLRLIKEKYALVYFFSDSSEVRQKTVSFCQKYGLRLIVIPYAKQEYNLSDQRGPGEKYEYVGPKEFVSLIRDAEFVFTDSFHGAVFSLIYQVPFAVFERNKAEHVSMNSRLYDLLDTFEEKDRLIDISRINNIEELLQIDRERIQSILNDKKDKSVSFLNAAIVKGIAEYQREIESVTVSGEEACCSGCGACASVCPQKCIKLKPNVNGFLIPEIDQIACIQCGKCKRICPFFNKPTCSESIKVVAAYTKKPEKKSASGGIGNVVSKRFIKDGGVVYGAAYDDSLKVRIVRVDREDQLERLQGSKYVQADMRNVIEQIIDDLKAGNNVLFTGTPCEVAGVRVAVERHKLQNNLYTVEIICHGTPSPQMFADYLEWAEKHYGKKIKTYAFRAKEKDTDKDFLVRIGFADESDIVLSGFKDPYYKLFMSSKWFRESCYECPFASKQRIADLTIGDFWNAERLPNSYGKGRRISVVLINSTKGQKMLEMIQEKVKIAESTWRVAKDGNPNLFRPTRKNSGYIVYSDVDKNLLFRNDGLENPKKYLFNQLPLSVRRQLKRISAKELQ